MTVMAVIIVDAVAIPVAVGIAFVKTYTGQGSVTLLNRG